MMRKTDWCAFWKGVFYVWGHPYTVVLVFTYAFVIWLYWWLQ